MRKAACPLLIGASANGGFLKSIGWNEFPYGRPVGPHPPPRTATPNLQNPYFYGYHRAPKCATVDRFHMTTRSSLADTAYPRGGYSPLGSRPSPPSRRISNRSYRRLEFNISPTKQRTGVLSNRPKSADPARLASGVRRGGIGVLRDQRESKDLSSVFWRQMVPPCPGYSVAQERSFPLNRPGRRERVGCGSRPSKCDGKGRQARVSAPLGYARGGQDDDPGRKANKKLIATVPNSKFESSQCKQAPYRNPNRNKKCCFGFPFSPRPNSSAVGSLWNLKSRLAQHLGPRRAGAISWLRCHLFMAPGKTNSGVPTSKKAVRVVIVLEVYTPGRFLRRYL
jgi:hypothetical protein